MFEANSPKQARYKFIQKTLVKYEYMKLKRSDKGILIQFLCKVSGYSRQQLTRLIQRARSPDI
ncbi:MAG: hypothetical protein P8104_13370 [Gammaproteobacteria bacterium]